MVLFRGKILHAVLAAVLIFGCCAVQTDCLAAPAPKAQDKKAQAGKTKKPKESKSAKARRYYGNGLWAEMQDNWKEAVKDFKTVAVLEPQSYKARLHLARAYRKLSQGMDAITPLEQAIKIKPKNPQAYLYLMDVYWDMNGLLNEAVRVGDEAIANGVKPGYILSDMGWYYYLAGDNANAEDNLKKALKANPKDSLVLNDMGILLFSEGRYDKALDKFKEASKLNPASIMTPYLEAISYNKIGKEKEALEALKAGIKKDPSLKSKLEKYKNDFFPRTDPGDLSKLFAKLQPTPPTLKNMSVAAPLKNMSVTAPSGAARGK
ncbi:MAG: tetratricopeptide repeat protein [Nitrospirota bacterium]